LDIYISILNPIAALETCVWLL